MVDFATRVLAWWDEHGRKDLPWQKPPDAYRIWISEVMLQQTQVTTVIPYFQRFLDAFPDVRALAAATEDEVLAHWSGLGYYARARNLHAAARRVVAQHDAVMPTEPDALERLPGIGRSTAAAIASLATDRPHAILDGNVKRVLCRVHGIEACSGAPATIRELWGLAERLLPGTRGAAYTQAVMDLGATLCTRRKPSCDVCPVAAGCRARLLGRVDRIPAPRPRRDRPHARVRVLLARDDDGAVLLERRPPTGIWGGLWCLPALDPIAVDAARRRRSAADRTRLDGETVSTALGQSLVHLLDVGTLAAARPQPAVRHGFSHFTIELVPLLVELGRGPSPGRLAELDGRRWFTRGEALALGLPRPIRAILERRTTGPPTDAPAPALD